MGYNPEKRAWRGRSYKKGGASVTELRDLVRRMADKIGEDSLSDEGFHDLYTEAQDLLTRDIIDPPPSPAPDCGCGHPENMHLQEISGGARWCDWDKCPCIDYRPGEE